MLTFLESGLICVSQTVFPGGTHHVFLHVFLGKKMGKHWALGSRYVGMLSRPNFCIWQYVCHVISREKTLTEKPLASVLQV